MSLDLKTHLRKFNQPELLIAVIILLPFCFGTLIGLLRLPNAIKYILDVAWIFLLMLIIGTLIKRKMAFSSSVFLVCLWPICFFLYAVISYVFNYQAIVYFLWGFRNNFRFYVAFAAFVVFLRREDIKYYLRLFDILFWLNSAVCLFQYFVLGKYQDYLGGLFGVELGSNGNLNVFLVIAIIKTSVCYLNKRESFLSFLAKSGVSLIIAALSELKFFFIEFAVIFLLALLVARFSFRKLLFIVVGIIAIPLGIQLLKNLFPEFTDFYSIQAIIDSVTLRGYSTAESLNRLTAIPVISARFLTTAIAQAIGMGLGNCDTAAYEFLNTPFYEQYYFLRYNWFSTAAIYLEMGYTGLVFFFGFFVMICFVALHKSRLKNATPEDKIYSQIGAIMAVACCMIAVYNSSLRSEAAYMAYFVLSLAFIGDKRFLEQKQ